MNSSFICPYPLESFSSDDLPDYVTTIIAYENCAVPCPNIDFVRSQWRTLQIILMALINFSMVISAVVLFSHILEFKRYFIRVMFIGGFFGNGLVLSLFSMINIASNELTCYGNAHFIEKGGFCVLQAAAMIWFFIWINTWAVILSVDTFLHITQYMRPASIEKLKPFYVLVGFFIPSVVAIIPVLKGNLGFDPYVNMPICFYMISDDVNIFKYTFLIPYCLLLGVSIAFTIACTWRIHNVLISSNHYKSRFNAKKHHARQRIEMSSSLNPSGPELSSGMLYDESHLDSEFDICSRTRSVLSEINEEVGSYVADESVGRAWSGEVRPISRHQNPHSMPAHIVSSPFALPSLNDNFSGDQWGEVRTRPNSSPASSGTAQGSSQSEPDAVATDPAAAVAPDPVAAVAPDPVAAVAPDPYDVEQSEGSHEDAAKTKYIDSCVASDGQSSDARYSVELDPTLASVASVSTASNFEPDTPPGSITYRVYQYLIWSMKALGTMSLPSARNENAEVSKFMMRVRAIWHYNGRSILMVVAFGVNALSVVPVLVYLLIKQFPTFLDSANEFVSCLVSASISSPSQTQAAVNAFAKESCGDVPREAPSYVLLMAMYIMIAAYPIVPLIVFGLGGKMTQQQQQQS